MREGALTQPRRFRRRGFTIVEAICAITIMAVALPASLWMIRGATQRRVDPILAARARWLVVERMEQVLMDRHNSSRGYAYIDGSNYASEASVSGFSNMSRAVSVVETGPNLSSAGTGYKRVMVTVSFRDGRNILRTMGMSTVVTDYTP